LACAESSALGFYLSQSGRPYRCAL